MDSEVIVIDDSPPSSPVNKAASVVNIFRTVTATGKTVVPAPQIHELPHKPFTANSTMNLSLPENNSTTGLSNEIINLTVNQAENTNAIDPALIEELKSRGVVIRTSKNVTNGGQFSYNSNQYFSNHSYGLKYSNVALNSVYFPGRQSISGCYNGHSYMPAVKFDDNYQYFAQTFPQNSYYEVTEGVNMQYMPEYIDINNLMTYNDQSLSTYMSGTLLESNKIIQTTECKTKTTSLKNNKRYEKNSVPLFLKRNRNLPENKMKVIDLSTEDTNEKINNSNSKNEIAESKDDDVEIVYVGAYAREPKFPCIQPTVYKLPVIEEEKENVQNMVNSQSPISVTDSVSDTQNSQEVSSDDKTKGTRKRKPVVTVPRRNPKRQVQIEKDYLKLLDNVICESKKETRTRKVKRTNRSTGNDSKKTNSENKRGTRQVTNCGAIYRPPSPLSIRHLRDWPESGMHERPEYNCVTRKLEQFDYLIRDISVKYNNGRQANKPAHNVPESKVASHSKEIWWVCHETLHHVLAYGATVQSLLNEGKPEDNTHDKVEFMKDLSLVTPSNSPLNLTKSNKVSLFDKETEEEKQKVHDDLKELMENSLLLYCLTNDVDRDHLAKYIESLNPEEIIQWSNKQFNLV